MTITTYGTICSVGGIPHAFLQKAVGADFYVSRDFAGKLSRPGMAFWSCRNEELFQPALAAEMPLTSMILGAEAHPHEEPARRTIVIAP